MRTVEFPFQGNVYYLCLNGAALFEIYEHFGTKGSVLDHIGGNGKKPFLAVCWMLSKLAEQGELVRRFQGYDHGTFPTEQMFRTMLAPLDVPRAKSAISEAYRLGFQQEEAPEKKRVDLGLLELQKKRDRHDKSPVPAFGYPVPGAVCPGGPADDAGAVERPGLSGTPASRDQE